MICPKCFNEITSGICFHCGFDPDIYEHQPTFLPVWTTLKNRYTVGVCIGDGGAGITYACYDNYKSTRCAIKEFLPSQTAVRDISTMNVVASSSRNEARFEEGKSKVYYEAATLSRLKDIPAIVDVYDFFYENNTAYIVMEFVEGVSVEQLANQYGGRLDQSMIWHIYLPVIVALECVHKDNILHRDLTPSNIIMDTQFNPRIIDFGAARNFSLGQSSDMTAMLKPGYAPAEQYSRHGNHGPWEDVYAVCASIYSSLTGYLPPDGYERLGEDKIVPLSSFGLSVPPELEKVLMKGLAPYVEDRYANMSQLLDALCSALGLNSADARRRYTASHYESPSSPPKNASPDTEKNISSAPAVPPKTNERRYRTENKSLQIKYIALIVGSAIFSALLITAIVLLLV